MYRKSSDVWSWCLSDFSYWSANTITTVIQQDPHLKNYCSAFRYWIFYILNILKCKLNNGAEKQYISLIPMTESHHSCDSLKIKHADFFFLILLTFRWRQVVDKLCSCKLDCCSVLLSSLMTVMRTILIKITAIKVM